MAYRLSPCCKLGISWDSPHFFFLSLMDHRLSLDFQCLKAHCHVYFFLVFKLLVAEDVNLIIPVVLPWLEVEVAIIVFSEDSLAFYISILNVFFFWLSNSSRLLVAGDITVNMIMYFPMAYNRLEWQTQKQKEMNNYNIFCWEVIKNAKEKKRGGRTHCIQGGMGSLKGVYLIITYWN